jgi:hypothetical protein
MEDAKSKFLIDTRSNTHFEEGDKVLELSKDGLKKYFNVTEVKLSD